MRSVGFLAVALLTLGPAAQAQEVESQLLDKMNRLERDVNFLQKQVYRGGAAGDDGSITSTVPAGNVGGNAEVRFSQIDEQLRQIRGQIEQAQFQSKQTAADMKKLSEDIDYRLRALEQKQAALDAAAAPAAAAPVAAPTATAEHTPEAAASASTYQPDVNNKGTAAAALTGNDFPDANAQYTAAFKLLSDKKYPEAATALDAFVKKYPSDPLTSNAYYWLGESYYARADYTRAAESFRKGFEQNPTAQKAADNLYKLALSLNQVKRTSEACIVLSQVISKYADKSARTVAKAVEQRNVMQCK